MMNDIETESSYEIGLAENKKGILTLQICDRFLNRNIGMIF